jgi:cytochrome c oxidase subunit IV
MSDHGVGAAGPVHAHPHGRGPGHDYGPDQGDGQDHVVPVTIYVAVFAALLVLTIATVAASRLDLGALNTPVALAIAITKATLVVLFFMHVRWSPRLIGLAFAASLFWLFHMLAGTAVDYLSRSDVDPRPNHPVGDRPASP